MSRKLVSASFYSFLRQHVAEILAVFLLICSSHLTAQDRAELERNKRQIEQEITLLNQLLKETQSTAETSLSQLVILNNRIETRQNLISNINNEIDFISRRIAETISEKEQLEKELEELKESYARMIYYAQRNRNSYQRMMFLFSSRDFNQAYLRLRYLQQLTRHRQVQAEKIVETAARLEENIIELEARRAEQQVLLDEQKEEVNQLTQERATQSKNVEQLKQKEKELLQQLREQEQAARQLQQAIERVIAEERRKAEEAARAAGKPATEAFSLTPEEQLISSNFAGNKGKLPWPLERGIITGSFGEQPHPVLPGIKIVNNGIDISTTRGSHARAIFEGTVARVFSIAGGYAVIIRHGEYLTVYSHLSEVFVTNGEKVEVRQEIGMVATDAREAKTYVNLQVWHGNDKLNPAQWITSNR
ncbi:MAG: murein hydrolase activator EnvC family protein [bacterium]